MGYRWCAAHPFASPLNGLAYGLRMPAGNGGNFIEGKSFNAVEQERFAVRAVGAPQRGMHKSDHFVGIGRLFRSGNAAVGDHALARPSLIGLMVLQSGLVARLN